MNEFPSNISNRIKRKFRNKNPDLLLYIDNPYIESLIDDLIEVISGELADIRNEYVSKKDLKLR